jgi:exonuclease III
MRAIKLATFNINNINRRLPNLLRWLKDAKPDVVCIQELKCTDSPDAAADPLPIKLIDSDGNFVTAGAKS